MLDAARDYLEVSGCQSAHNQNIALKSLSLQVLTRPQRQVQLGLPQRNTLDDLCLLLEFPSEPESLEASEGIQIGIMCEEFNLLDFVDIHHSGLGGDGDLIQSANSDGDVELRVAGTVTSSDVNRR